MALVGSTLWIVTRGNGQIERYDLRAQHGTTTASGGAAPYDIAADADGNVWVSQRKPDVTWILHRSRQRHRPLRNAGADHRRTSPYPWQGPARRRSAAATCG